MDKRQLWLTRNDPVHQGMYQLPQLQIQHPIPTQAHIRLLWFHDQIVEEKKWWIELLLGWASSGKVRWYRISQDCGQCYILIECWVHQGWPSLCGIPSLSDSQAMRLMYHAWGFAVSTAPSQVQPWLMLGLGDFINPHCWLFGQGTGLCGHIGGLVKCWRWW